MIYRYYNRPAYGSDERLIEFISGSEKESFTNDFLNAIASLGPNLEEVLDLWMNDEIMLSFTSNKGTFILTKDIWGFAFVMAKQNQPVINIIDELLQSHPDFEKVDVDEQRYK